MTAVQQPPPVRNTHPNIPDLIRDDLTERTYLGAHRHGVRARVAERAAEGVARYGTPLQPFNGRDALADLDDELVDGGQYARQALVEIEARDPANPDLPRLRAMYDDLLHMACALREIRAGMNGRE